MGSELTRAEINEINKHKRLLSQERGHDVEFEAAKGDWLANHAVAWRSRRDAECRAEDAEMLEMEREEIGRHVWIESEKAQRDVRRQAALEWVLKYAAKWRDWYENEYRGRKS